jgi:hypothetical protein
MKTPCDTTDEKFFGYSNRETHETSRKNPCFICGFLEKALRSHRCDSMLRDIHPFAKD